MSHTQLILWMVISAALWCAAFFLMTSSRVSGWLNGTSLPEHREFDAVWKTKRVELQAQGLSEEEVFLECMLLMPMRRPLWKRILGTDLIADPRRNEGMDELRQAMRDELAVKKTRRTFWHKGQENVPQKASFDLPSFAATPGFFRVYEALEEKGPAVTKEESLGFIYLLETELCRVAWGRFIRLGGVQLLVIPSMAYLVFAKGEVSFEVMFRQTGFAWLMKGVGVLAIVAGGVIAVTSLVALISEIRHAGAQTKRLLAMIERGEKLIF